MKHYFLIFLLAFSCCAPSLIGQVDERPDSLIIDSLAADSNRVPDSIAAIVDIQDEFAAEEKIEEKRFSLRSPYHTMWSHLHYTGDKEFHPDSAALTLFMSPEDRKDGKDIELAIHLKQYMDGAGHYIYLDEVPDDPDYTDSTGRHVYYPVPSVKEIYLYKRGNSWFYSAKTVRSIPDLYDSVFPFGTLDFIPAWAKPRFLGVRIWKWIGIILFILAAFLFQKLFSYLLGKIIELITNRILRSDIDEQLFLVLARPLSLFFMTFLLAYFTPILQLPIEVNKWVMLSLRIAQPIFIVVVVYRLVDVFKAFWMMRAAKTPSKMDDQLVPLVAKIARVMVVIAGSVVVLQYLEVNITALLAGISIGGIALALAAQDTVSNFFGSVMIFVDQPFTVGDWIVAGDLEGTVEEVGIRSTKIRTFEQSVVSVPNGTLANMAIDNKGLRPIRRFKTGLGLTYDTPPELIEAYVEGLRGIIEKHPATYKNFEIHFNSMGDFSLNLLIYIFFDVPSWTEELKARQELLLGFMRLASEIGVNFAFPTQTLQIETFPEKQGLSPVYGGDKASYEAQVAKFVEEWAKKDFAFHQYDASGDTDIKNEADEG